jgi:hypothetical protein
VAVVTVLAFTSLAPKPRKPNEANVKVNTSSFFISTLHFQKFHCAHLQSESLTEEREPV